jgi:hypothetical protein
MQARGQRPIAEINRRVVHHFSRAADDQPKAPAFVKERETVAPCIVVHTLLADAGYDALAHEMKNLARLKAQSASDDRRIDAHGAVVDLDAGACRRGTGRAFMHRSTSRRSAQLRKS